jgi:cytochrome c553
MARQIVVFLSALFSALAWADPGDTRKVAEDKCLLCHTVRAGEAYGYPILEGQPAAYFTDQVRAFRSKRRTTSAGVMLLNVANLTDREIADLAAFFGSKPPQQPGPQVDSARAAAGRTRLRDLHCHTCHGPNLVGQGSAARLAGQNPKYTAYQLRKIRWKDREHPADAAVELTSLSEDDVVDIAHALAAMK